MARDVDARGKKDDIVAFAFFHNMPASMTPSVTSPELNLLALPPLSSSPFVKISAMNSTTRDKVRVRKPRKPTQKVSRLLSLEMTPMVAKR